MKIIYKAFDGKEFDSVTECAAYEEQMNKLKMWFKDGKTTLVDEAYVVKLDNTNDTKIFVDRCNAVGSDCCGIGYDDDCADIGLFVWDTNRCEYFYVCDSVLNSLVHYLKDEHIV